MTFLNFPFFRQLDAMDCGPTCLQMIAKYYGKTFSLQFLREKCYIDREGVSLKGIIHAAEQIGFSTMPVQIPFETDGEQLGLEQAPLPAIVHWNQRHFLVIYKISSKWVWIADPGASKLKLSHTQFKQSWLGDNNMQGIALLLEPSGAFYQEDKDVTNRSFKYLLHYILPHQRLLVQLALGLLLGSVFQLIFPFLTQSIVDIGIDTRNIPFIYMVLLGEFVLIISQILVRFLQNWILMHISIRIDVHLIGDFLSRLMRLPLAFFDSKHTGDLIQRIGDHQRIESFLTNSLLSFVFAVFNLIIFSFVLVSYSLPIFAIYGVSAIFYVLWVTFFFKKRKEIDYQAFQWSSSNQNTLLDIIQGMSEIKLQNSQLKRRWGWSDIQARLFRVRQQSLSISQYQETGAMFINQVKDMLITVWTAQAVIEGKMSLGMMLAVQYIIGQLNAPLQQLVGFLRTAQDAKISLDRLNEIQVMETEDAHEDTQQTFVNEQDIEIENVSFRYNPISDDVLSDLSLTIPRGRVTAIVGRSGSGKTTLVKLLLGFYSPTKGRIRIGKQPLNAIQPKIWREKCGAVMQDGYIFSDTIANNICESIQQIHYDQLLQAAETANIQDFIETLPLGFQTMIGARGNGVSQGQRQRLLIARAVYKNPEFIFFDEATNALDAHNERTILDNMQQFFQGKTVIVVAHRLSTVKNADQIVVLHEGKIAEIGTHRSLIEAKGQYYELIKNQLELGT